MRMALDTNLQVALRWLLGLLLVWAALSKLANVGEFYGQLLGYRLPLPNLLLKLTAAILPWLELLCGLLLLANRLTLPALTWAQVLFVIFIVATGQAWWRGLKIDCGCLNLSLLGFAPDGAASRFLQSTGFAFFRALGLAFAGGYLLRCGTHAGATQLARNSINPSALRSRTEGGSGTQS